MYKNKDAVIYYNPFFTIFFSKCDFCNEWFMNINFKPWRFLEVFNSLDSMRIDFRGSEPWLRSGWAGLGWVKSGECWKFNGVFKKSWLFLSPVYAGRIYFILLCWAHCISSFTTLFEVTPPLFPPQIVMIGPPTAWNNGASYTGAHVQPTSRNAMLRSPYHRKWIWKKKDETQYI